MLEDPRSLSQEPKAQSEESLSVPPLPTELDELQRNPEKSRAVPTMVRLEELETEQILRLLEKLEFPINDDGLEQIDAILRKSMDHLRPLLFFDAQIDGCPINVLFTQQFRVGKGNAKEIRTAAITPEDLTAPYPHMKITLDTFGAEQGVFNLTIDFDIEKIYGLDLQKEVWLELDKILAHIDIDALPETFHHVERFCFHDNSERLCVVAALKNGCTVGLLPLESQEEPEKTSPVETPAPAETPSIMTRVPHAIYINKPSVDDLRIIARELGDGESSQFSTFDDLRGDDSFLTNAVKLVQDEVAVDLNTWEMHGFKDKLVIMVNRPLTIGNSEYGTGMAFTATASNIESYDPNEDTGSSFEEAEEEEDDDEQSEPISHSLMSDVGNPDISIFPEGEGTDVSLTISMENYIFSGADGSSEKTLTASLHFGPELSLQERWAIVDRLTRYFDDTVITNEPRVNEVPGDHPYVVIERVGLHLSTT